MKFLSEIDLFKFMEKFFYAELKLGKGTQRVWDKYGIM